MFEVIGTFGGQILVNSFYAVDTFFFQSGLLLSFLWFRAYKRNPKRVTAVSSWVMFYVHRILRLSPAYFMVIAFYTFVYTHFVAQLPLFFGVPGRMGECKTKYWYNFLYINNIVGVKDPVSFRQFFNQFKIKCIYIFKNSKENLIYQSYF